MVNTRRYGTVPQRLAQGSNYDLSQDGCISWQGYTSDGYGIMQVEGKSKRIHRVAWELYVGVIPNGLTLDHLCKNRRCWNVAHLELVTAAENSRRAGKINPKRLWTHCVRGHEFTEDNTAINKNGTRRCRTCEKMRSTRGG